MSCSSNSSTPEPAPHRRRVLLTLAAAGAGWPVLSAHAAVAPVAGLRRWGSGEFRRFGLLVYEATLWAGDDPLRPPLALRLDYRRRLRGAAIADASVQEMRRFVSDEDLLRDAGEQMRRIFPDVQPGDHLVGVHRPDGAHFYQGERTIGVIRRPGFAEAFFAIWLDPRTSAPELRTALLRRPGA